MSMVTNTNPTGSQSQPGGMNAVAIIEPVLSKAARQLGIDQVEMRGSTRRRAGPVGPAGPNGRRGTVTSAFVKEALDRGAELFGGKSGRRGPRTRRIKGARDRRRGEPVPSRDRSASTACSSSSPTAGSPFNRALAISAPTRSSTCIAWSPRCSTCRGRSATSRGGTRPRTCRGRAFQAAARRSTR